MIFNFSEKYDARFFFWERQSYDGYLIKIENNAAKIIPVYTGYGKLYNQR